MKERYREKFISSLYLNVNKRSILFLLPIRLSWLNMMRIDIHLDVHFDLWTSRMMNHANILINVYRWNFNHYQISKHISLSATVLEISEWDNEPLRRKYCASSIYTSSIAVNNVRWQSRACNSGHALKVKYTPDLVPRKYNTTTGGGRISSVVFASRPILRIATRTRIVLLRDSPRAGECIV